MKVLQVIHDFLPQCAAGSELFTYWLSRSLQSAGVECEVFCGEDSQVAGEAITQDEVDGLPTTRLHRRALSSTSSTKRWCADVDQLFERELSRIKPNVVHFHHFAGLSLGMAAIVKRAGLPSILTLHDYWFICPRFHLINSAGSLCSKQPGRHCIDCLWPREQSRLLNPVFGPAVWVIKRLLSKLPDWLPVVDKAKDILRESVSWLADSQDVIDDINVLVAPTAFVARKLSETGLRHRDVRVIKNGIDVSRFRNISRSPHKRPRFGFIGSHTYKGLKVLIEAFELLPAGASELHIYGRVPESLASRINLLMSRRSVYVHGSFDPGEIAHVFESFDVLVVPSLVYETSSLVITEAFASKVPVVASNIGALAEGVRHGINGLLFERGNPQDLAAKLKCFIDDPCLASRLASAAKVRMIEDAAQEYLALYKELLKHNLSRHERVAE